MILLAPQMAYLEPKTIEICQDHCHVETIDAYAFATFNYQKTLNMIENYFMS